MCGIHVHPAVDGSAMVPAATIVDQLLGTLAFAGFNQIDLTEQFQNQGVNKSEVSSVVLSSMTITIQSPQGETFDFLESVAFFASADGLPEVEIAHLDMVPRSIGTLNLDIEPGVELAPYVVAPSMNIRTQISGSEPSQDTTLGAHVVFDADANLPGCSN
jgi:hypothetical protein